MIVLSTRARDEDRHDGYALDVDEYVTNPFDLARLVEIAGRSPSERTPRT